MSRKPETHSLGLTYSYYNPKDQKSVSSLEVLRVKDKALDMQGSTNLQSYSPQPCVTSLWALE